MNASKSQCRIKHKTELCNNYLKGIPCPHEPHCNFAHGEGELRCLTAADIEKEYGINAKAYRTKPCFCFVATCSCPFGQRCMGIHDPRVEGTVKAWLQHSKFPLLKLDIPPIYIDQLHAVISENIFLNNPFGLEMEVDDHRTFINLYDLITNKTNKVNLIMMKAAVYFLRYKSSDYLNYTPNSSILGEVCDITTITFDVTTDDKGAIQLIESSACNDSVKITAHMVKVNPPSGMMTPTKIYFGPLPLSADDDITENKIKEAIRSDRARSLFIALPYVDVFFPYDDDCFELVKDIMLHSIEQMEGNDVDQLEKKKKSLCTRFVSLMRFFKASSSFPINGSNKILKDSKVPSVSVQYDASPTCGSNNSKIAAIWESFVNTISEVSEFPQAGQSSFLHGYTRQNEISYNIPIIKADINKSLLPRRNTWQEIIQGETGQSSWDTLKGFYHI